MSRTQSLIGLTTEGEKDKLAVSDGVVQRLNDTTRRWRFVIRMEDSVDHALRNFFRFEEVMLSSAVRLWHFPDPASAGHLKDNSRAIALAFGNCCATAFALQEFFSTRRLGGEFSECLDAIQAVTVEASGEEEFHIKCAHALRNVMQHLYCPIAEIGYQVHEGGDGSNRYAFIPKLRLGTLEEATEQAHRGTAATLRSLIEQHGGEHAIELWPFVYYHMKHLVRCVHVFREAAQLFFEETDRQLGEEAPDLNALSHINVPDRRYPMQSLPLPCAEAHREVSSARLPHFPDQCDPLFSLTSVR